MPFVQLKIMASGFTIKEIMFTQSGNAFEGTAIIILSAFLILSTVSAL